MADMIDMSSEQEPRTKDDVLAEAEKMLIGTIVLAVLGFLLAGWMFTANRSQFAQYVSTEKVSMYSSNRILSGYTFGRVMAYILVLLSAGGLIGAANTPKVTEGEDVAIDSASRTTLAVAGYATMGAMVVVAAFSFYQYLSTNPTTIARFVGRGTTAQSMLDMKESNPVGYLQLMRASLSKNVGYVLLLTMATAIAAGVIGLITMLAFADKRGKLAASGMPADKFSDVKGAMINYYDALNHQNQDENKHSIFNIESNKLAGWPHGAVVVSQGVYSLDTQPATAPWIDPRPV